MTEKLTEKPVEQPQCGAKDKREVSPGLVKGLFQSQCQRQHVHRAGVWAESHHASPGLLREL